MQIQSLLLLVGAFTICTAAFQSGSYTLLEVTGIAENGGFLFGAYTTLNGSAYETTVYKMNFNYTIVDTAIIADFEYGGNMMQYINNKLVLHGRSPSANAAALVTVNPKNLVTSTHLVPIISQTRSAIITYTVVVGNNIYAIDIDWENVEDDLLYKFDFQYHVAAVANISSLNHGSSILVTSSNGNSVYLFGYDKSNNELMGGMINSDLSFTLQSFGVNYGTLAKNSFAYNNHLFVLSSGTLTIITEGNMTYTSFTTENDVALGCYAPFCYVFGSSTVYRFNLGIMDWDDSYTIYPVVAQYTITTSAGILYLWEEAEIRQYLLDIIQVLSPNVTLIQDGNNVTLEFTSADTDGFVATYQIFRDNVLVATTSSLTYTDVNLIAGTYSYCVKGSIGASISSCTPEAVTIAPPPTTGPVTTGSMSTTAASSAGAITTTGSTQVKSTTGSASSTTGTHTVPSSTTGVKINTTQSTTDNQTPILADRPMSSSSVITLPFQLICLCVAILLMNIL